MKRKSALNQELNHDLCKASPSPCLLVNCNYGAQSLVLCFITEALLHIAILRKGNETVMCSLVIHMTLTVFSLLTTFFCLVYLV